MLKIFMIIFSQFYDTHCLIEVCQGSTNLPVRAEVVEMDLMDQQMGLYTLFSATDNLISAERLHESIC